MGMVWWDERRHDELGDFHGDWMGSMEEVMRIAVENGDLVGFWWNLIRIEWDLNKQETWEEWTYTWDGIGM